MASTVLFTLDGVLRKPGTHVIIPQGRVIYQAIASTIRVGILGGTDREMDDYWLRSQGLLRHPDLFEERESDGQTIAERRLSQVSRARVRGATVESVVEPNPQVAAYLMDRAVPVLLFLSPRYTHPDFRPDAPRTTKPWDTLVATVNYQEELRVKDSRTEQEPE